MGYFKLRGATEQSTPLGCQWTSTVEPLPEVLSWPRCAAGPSTPGLGECCRTALAVDDAVEAQILVGRSDESPWFYLETPAGARAWPGLHGAQAPGWYGPPAEPD